jgi:hypothetical protein
MADRFARWTFDFPPGEYAVAAFWKHRPENAHSAEYTAHNGDDMFLDNKRVNQTAVPVSDFIVEGKPFEQLFVVNLTQNPLKIALHNNGPANEVFIADAVYAVEVGSSGKSSSGGLSSGRGSSGGGSSGKGSSGGSSSGRESSGGSGS